MRVLLVEEQPLYHDAVRELLGARIGRIEMSTAVIVADALDSIARSPPDLVVADFSTGDICGRPGIEGIVAQANTMVITLDARIIGSHLRRAQAAGAKAYIPKTSTRDLMSAAFNVVPQGEIGEIVGHSAGMMKGYNNQPGKTADAWWYDETGKKFMRFGDVGRFDEDGFLQLMDRKKDMIISGGFNIYPSDIEAIMMEKGDLLEVAVVGVESDRWGETPVAYVTPKPGAEVTPDAVKDWTNANPKIGKTQRLHDVRFVEALPRSAIGKVLKRELRDEYKAKFGVAG